MRITKLATVQRIAHIVIGQPTTWKAVIVDGDEVTELTGFDGRPTDEDLAPYLPAVETVEAE